MLYEVIIGNYLDDSTQSKLVLSTDELTKDEAIVLAGIDAETECILSIKKPSILINAWTEEEYDKLMDIKNSISKP